MNKEKQVIKVMIGNLNKEWEMVEELICFYGRLY